jgi:hypothetical protein
MNAGRSTQYPTRTVPRCVDVVNTRRGYLLGVQCGGSDLCIDMSRGGSRGGRAGDFAMSRGRSESKDRHGESPRSAGRDTSALSLIVDSHHSAVVRT